MIKAEVISHEGNPGPNWLDRCRTLITPGSITALVLIVGIAAVVVGLNAKHSSDVEKASAKTSQPAAAAAAPLTVKPLTAKTYQTVDGAPTVQDASGGTSVPASNAALEETPLNATATTPDAAEQTKYNQQTTLRGRSLTNGVQSTLRSVDSSVKTTQKAKNKLKKELGL